MGACVSRGDRAECRRCARLPAPSSASPFADAVADAALLGSEAPKRGSLLLGRTLANRDAGVTPLTARALAQKALEYGDDSCRSEDDSDEDWRSAKSAQTARSWSAASGREEVFGACAPRDTSRENGVSPNGGAPGDDGSDAALDGPNARPQPLATTETSRDAPPNAGARRTESAAATTDDDAEADAFRALALVTADFEEDAVCKLKKEEEEEEEENKEEETGIATIGSDDAGITTRRSGGGVETAVDARRVKPRGKKAGNFVTRRVAKIKEGARMFNAVREALRRTGGVLDLTRFSGTPMKWHAPHSALLAHARGKSTLRRSRLAREAAKKRRSGRSYATLVPSFREDTTASSSTSTRLHSNPSYRAFSGFGNAEESTEWTRELERRPPRAARLFTSLKKSFSGGAFREEFFGADPELARMLKVLAALFADCEPPAHLQKPLNPVLGETARHEIRFSDGHRVLSVLEQTSHHPPVTAFHSAHGFPNDAASSFQVFGHFQPQPSLRGLGGKVDIDIHGVRVFRVRADDGAREDYVANYVGFEWLFFPAARARIRAEDPHVVRCEATNLLAEIAHVRGTDGMGIKGSVYRVETDHTRTPLCDVSGRLDARIEATPRSGASASKKQKEASIVVYDAEVASMDEIESVVSDIAFDLVEDARGSHAVWGGVTSALLAKPPRWDDARRGKRAVEAAERARRSEEKTQSTGKRAPRYFEYDRGKGTWVLRADLLEKNEEPRPAPAWE